MSESKGDMKETGAFGLPEGLHFEIIPSQIAMQRECQQAKVAEEHRASLPRNKSVVVRESIKDTLKGSHPNTETSDFASLKVIELSRRLRELTACLLTERMKNRQLEDKVKMLESKLNKYEQNADSVRSDTYRQRSENLTASQANNCDRCQSTKTVLDKLTKAEFTMNALRNENHAMKNELREAKMVLELETGEKIDNIHLWLKEVAAKRDIRPTQQGNPQRGWRGRQQQISLLKAKVKSLESRLNCSKNLDFNLSVGNTIDDENNQESNELAVFESSGATMLGLESLFLDVDRSLDLSNVALCPSTQQQCIRRQNRLVLLEKENDQLKTEVSSLKLKYSKAKSHETNLATDVKEFKLRIEKLLDKGRHDDELIDVLVANNRTLQDSLKSELERRVKAEQELMSEIENLTSKLNQKKNEMDKLETILSQKDEELMVLEKELKCTGNTPVDRAGVDRSTEAGHRSDCDSNLAKEVSLLQIERDGLRALIECINARVDTLLEENSKLQLECSMARQTSTRNEHSKRRIPSHTGSNNSNKSGSADTPNSAALEQKYDRNNTERLVSREFLSSTLSKAGLGASAASIVSKRMSELQTALSYLNSEVEALKGLRDKLQAARREDFNLLAEVVKQLRNSSMDEKSVN